MSALAAEEKHCFQVSMSTFDKQRASTAQPRQKSKVTKKHAALCDKEEMMATVAALCSSARYKINCLATCEKTSNDNKARSATCRATFCR